MHCKDSVVLTGVHTEVLKAMKKADELLGGYFTCGEITITSARDGKHKSDRHPLGMAFDIRTHNGDGKQFRKSIRNEMVAKLDASLPTAFDIVDEGDHFHVELDRRGGKG
jgi:hypothetical protein